MAVWLTGMHLSPLLLLPVLQFSPWLKLLLGSIVLYSLLDSWRRQVRRSHPDAIRSVVWKDTQHSQLTLTSGQQLDVVLASQAFILPWLVVLHFKTPDRRFRYLPVLSDMLDEDVFRRLRARLRMAIDAGAT